MKSLIGNPVYTHPVYGKIKIVGGTDNVIKVRNVFDDSEHAITAHELSTCKLDESHAKTVRPFGTKTRTMTGWNTSVEFEALIKGKVHSFAFHGRGKARVETLYMHDIEEAREWLLARETNPSCRGIIKRTSKLNTLRAIAYNLADGKDARGF